MVLSSTVLAPYDAKMSNPLCLPPPAGRPFLFHHSLIYSFLVTPPVALETSLWNALVTLTGFNGGLTGEISKVSSYISMTSKAAEGLHCEK